MKKALFVHPQFAVLGGAELVAIHMLQWLLESERYQVTLLTMLPPDFGHVYQATGLKVIPERLSIRTATLPFRLERLQGKFEMIKIAYLHRVAREMSDGFDVCISSYNELDFGPGAIGVQYIHHPILAHREKLHKHRILELASVRDKIPFVNDAYANIVNLIRGGGDGFRRNLTMVNSNYMQELVRSVYGIESTVVYPGLLHNGDLGTSLRWEEREFSFVSVGRISEDKQVLPSLRLFRALADAFPDAVFIMAGRIADSAYFRKVRREAQKLHLPLQFVIDSPREHIDTLLGKSKFYVHPKSHEHFGIAILEAANAGCLTFVPDSGGQREIIAPPMLRFSSVHELVQNVARLMKEVPLRSRVLRDLRSGLSPFRVSAFRKGLSEVMAGR